MVTKNNTEFVREILADEGYKFDPVQIDHGDCTVLNFSDGIDKWTTFIYSYENVATLRFYSMIATVTSPSIHNERVLWLLNEVNSQALLESHLDFLQDSRTLRFKASFSRPGLGLPLIETRDAIRGHLSRSMYLHHLFKAAYSQPLMPPAAAIDAAHTAAKSVMANRQAPPFF